MNTTLAYLRGRRAWLVENIAVWGVDNDAVFYLAGAETVGSDKRVGFWQAALGGQNQDLLFGDLTDNRGSKLPSSISQPTIIVIPRQSGGAFVKSVNGGTGFSLVKSDNTSSTVTVDLLIFETGL